MENRIFTLNKKQINKLIKKHGAELTGTLKMTKIATVKVVQIVLPENVNELVTVQDVLGNHLGYITVKEAWAL